MGIRFSTIYIDRNPNNPDEGWGWVEFTRDDIKRFGIPDKHPVTRRVTRTKEITTTRYKNLVPYTETYIDTYEDFVSPPSRGRTGAKKFTLNIDEELLGLSALLC